MFRTPRIGSSAIRADVVLEARPDIVGHINGGTTALPDADIEQLVASGMAIEIVHCGNGRAALFALGLAREAGALDRVILGNDAPSGTGVVPLGILRTMAHLASLGGIAPETAVCLATGNTARIHRLETGTIAVGREADLTLVDAPQGSAADTALGALAKVERLLASESEARGDRLQRDARAQLGVQLRVTVALESRDCLVDERRDPAVDPPLRTFRREGRLRERTVPIGQFITLAISS